MSQFCEQEELDQHELNDCFFPKGGIPSFGVLKSGHGITDFSNAIQTQAAIDAGLLRIFNKVKANLPEASAVEGENVTGCGAETIVDGFDYTLDIKDFNINANNDALVRQLNSGEFEGLIFYMCDQDSIRVVLQKITAVATLIIPETKRDKQYYHYIFKWYQSAQTDVPTLYDAPEGIYFQN